jgi:hypothetical protein
VDQDSCRAVKEVSAIKSYGEKIIVLLIIVVLLAFITAVSADLLVNRTPEIQGLATATSVNVQGTVTETDSGAWVTRDDLYFDVFGTDDPPFYGFGPGALTDPLLGDQEMVTTGYNDNIAAVSGQTTLLKSVGISTGNQIADGSNFKAATDMQYIAIDTGRATRSEDLLIDSAGNETDPVEIYILCPFASENLVDDDIPAHCNIAQAGSSIDTTLTSVVTSADDRFVGTDSAIPVVLNYNINAKGITLGNQSSPMIGSVSAYLKVHVQEGGETNFSGDFASAVKSATTKAEDLSYSETSTASGLISGFSKSMNYQSGLTLI